MRSTPASCAGLAALLLGLAATPLPLAAWFPAGHAKVSRSAVAALPREVPEFFRSAGWAIGEASVDPDMMKSRATPQLRAAEYPEHFLDSELLQGAHLPPDRYAYYRLAHDRRMDPARMGTLPYALVESMQRLTMAFADHRKWPDDPYVRQRALLYAGYLSHYAGDLEQPLHTSIHHDGRAQPPEYESPQTGIHQLVDGLFERAPVDTAAAIRDLPVEEMADPWEAVRQEFARSHALLDRVYALEAQLRQGAESRVYPAPVLAFAQERYRATAGFLASLYYTAWRRSAQLELPDWHDRPREPKPGAEIILRRP